MNKIEVISKNEIVSNLGDSLLIDTSSDSLIINVLGVFKEPLRLVNNIYNNIVINVSDNAFINLIEIKDNTVMSSFTYKYNLSENSKAIINKFYYKDEYDERTVVDLNGYGAEVSFNLSTTSFKHQQYNISINHYNKKTTSNVYNNGVTFNNGDIDLQVNGFVKKGMSDSILNQDNKIITMGNGKSTIKPNLFIDENMVEARHGASIGRFNEDEIFYLETRGIPISEGYYLLLNGFLIDKLKINEEIKIELNNIIEKFGR